MDRRTVLKGGLVLAATANTVAYAPALADPLLNAIQAYHSGCAAYSAASADFEERGDEATLVASTYGPPMTALCHWGDPARSPAGAIEALKLIKSESMLIDGMGEAMVDAAIGYLETLAV